MPEQLLEPRPSASKALSQRCRESMGQDSMMVESEASLKKCVPGSVLHTEYGLSRYVLNNVAVPPMGSWPNPIQVDFGIIWWMTDFVVEIFPGAFVSWL